jgi:predicted ATPase/DNA-binding CsgD family transcriptional regulator
VTADPGEIRAQARVRHGRCTAPLTSFVGREREIADVCRLLGGTRLLTLTGAGGCGKSRLAIEVAARVLDDFPDGVWVIGLAALTDSDLIPHTVASVLGLPEQPDRAPTGVLAEYLSSRRVLLILDNCEHLAACADLADALLRAASGLRLVATSRAGLGVPGERLWRVPSLSVPAAGQVPSRGLIEYEATRLFLERAAAVRSDFHVTDGSAPAVAQVCRRLDGIPLAIELAAARVGALTVEQIAARLDDRFGLLTGGSRTALPRHRTLRATMDWSYDLLPDRERTILNRLSIFAGGWTLEAAEAVCAEDGIDSPAVLDALTSLVDKSLVNVEMPADAARYRLLETIRQYARDRLDESGETDAVRRRHRDYYLALAEAAAPNLRGPDERAWLDRLELEHDNLRAALQWSAAESGGIEKGLRLAGALGEFWDARNYYTEGRVWLRELFAADVPVAPAVRLRAVNAAASLAKHQGDLDNFSQLVHELLALSQSQGDTWGRAWACHYLMHVADDQGDYPRAAALIEEGLGLAREIKDTFAATSLLTCAGDLERGQHHYDRAAVFLEEALRLSNEMGSARSKIAPLHNLGYAMLRRGDEQGAAGLFREGLTLAREVRMTRNIICGIGAVAGTYIERAPDLAARLFGAMEALRVTAGLHLMSVDQADVSRNVAAVRDRLGHDRFEAAWTAGEMMTLEEAADAALAGDAAAGRIARTPGSTTAGSQPDGLTPREREVASLIAEGLSNREIASRLVIAERTAEGHVQSIFNKLGFKSRAKIAAWAAKQNAGATPA